MIKTELVFLLYFVMILTEIQLPVIKRYLINIGHIKTQALTNAFCKARLKTVHRVWNAPHA